MLEAGQCLLKMNINAHCPTYNWSQNMLQLNPDSDSDQQSAHEDTICAAAVRRVVKVPMIKRRKNVAQ